MKVGDFVLCINDTIKTDYNGGTDYKFDEVTIGKLYKIVDKRIVTVPKWQNTIVVIDDLGKERSFVEESDQPFFKVITLDEYRDLQLNKLLNESR